MKNFKTMIHSSDNEDNYIQDLTVSKVHEEHLYADIQFEEAIIEGDNHKTRSSPSPI